jgi:putative DNA primase/helicase
VSGIVESTSPAAERDLGTTEWFAETVQMVIEMGYRVTPVYPGGATKPFAKGQTYTDLSDYKDAVHIGVVLDNAVLLDYDGNKSSAIMSVQELALKLGVENLPAPVQENVAGDSLHYLFKIPYGTDAKKIKASADGWFPHIDVKTGNQLMHLKPVKIINDSELPQVATLPDTPPILLDALRSDMQGADGFKGAVWEGSKAELSQATEILTYIDSNCNYDLWLRVLIGIHSKFGATDEAFNLANTWSQGGDSYCGTKIITYKLASIEQGPAGSAVTWGTVCFEAKKAGADLSAIAQLFNIDGSRRRSFDELMATAEGLERDYVPAELEAICRDAVPLSKMQWRKLSKLVKEKTKIPLCDLNSQRNGSAREGKDDDLDQLDLAKEIIVKIGGENIIGVPQDIYHWPGSGVWEIMEERTIKAHVHSFLPGKVDAVTRATVDAVTDLFKTEVFRQHHTFNVGPQSAVNCLNGEVVYNSDAWSVTPAVREHYRTTQIPVLFDRGATCPKFDQFLADIFNGDPDANDKQQAILEMMGYSLMAHCKHEKFLILVGGGANGKSVLLAVLEQLCGVKNVAGVQPSQFDRSFQRAHLDGKLVNIVTEVKQGEVIDDAALKGIVSGEPTTVEHKFKNPFEMRPFSTCWFGTNHMPHTRDFSDALFRRALVVPFNNVFKPELGNCNQDLKYELFKELPGILNSALAAYSTAIKHGDFTMPESCLKARDDWRIEADQVAQYVEDNCMKDKATRETSADLFADYVLWANRQGIALQMKQKGFAKRLEALGFTLARTKAARMVEGIRIGRPALGPWQ